MKHLSLPDALARAGSTYQELALALGVAPSTIWKWCSTDKRYLRSAPAAGQLSESAAFLRLGAQEHAAVAEWFAARARGEVSGGPPTSDR